MQVAEQARSAEKTEPVSNKIVPVGDASQTETHTKQVCAQRAKSEAGQG